MPKRLITALMASALAIQATPAPALARAAEGLTAVTSGLARPLHTQDNTAEYNGNGYTSVADAISAAGAGDTVALTSNATDPIEIDKDLTLNLGPHNVIHAGTAGGSAIHITNGARVTILGSGRDSSTGALKGSITSTGATDDAVIIVDAGCRLILGTSSTTIVTVQGDMGTSKPVIELADGTDSSRAVLDLRYAEVEVADGKDAQCLVQAGAYSELTVNSAAQLYGTAQTISYRGSLGSVADAAIISKGAAKVYVQNGGVVTTAKGVGVQLLGATTGAVPTELNINGGSVTQTGTGTDANYAVAGDKSYTGTTTIVQGNATTHGIVTSAEDIAIFHPQDGTLTVGASAIVTGAVGIQMRAGTLEVTTGGPTISSNNASKVYDTPEATGRSDGSVLDGAAISLVRESGDADLSVILSGGAFTPKSTNLKVALYSWSGSAVTTSSFLATTAIQVNSSLSGADEIIKAMSKWAPDQFASAKVEHTSSTSQTVVTNYLVAATHVITTSAGGVRSLTAVPADTTTTLDVMFTTAVTSDARTPKLTVYDASAAGTVLESGDLDNGTTVVNATNHSYNPETSTGDLSKQVKVDNTRGATTGSVKEVEAGDTKVVGINSVKLYDGSGNELSANGGAAAKGTTLNFEAKFEEFQPKNPDSFWSEAGTMPLSWTYESPYGGSVITLENPTADKKTAKVVVKDDAEFTVKVYATANSGVSSSVTYNPGTSPEDYLDHDAPIDLSKCKITLEQDKYIYDGTAKQPKVTVTQPWDGGESLTLDVDYTVQYTNNTAISSASSRGTVTITAVSGSSKAKEGTSAVVYFDIVSDKDISAATDIVLLKPGESAVAVYDYNGEAKHPIPTNGKLLNTTLVYGTDFIIDTSYGDNGYANNVNAGNPQSENPPTVRLKGIGNYTGYLDVYFTINPLDISGRATVTIDQESYVYDGKKHTPTVTKVTYTKANNETVELQQGTDFTVLADHNLNVNSAVNQPVVTVYGAGNYGGSVNKVFTITPRDFSSTAIEVTPPPNQPYTGDVIQPDVTVVDTDILTTDPGDRLLHRDVDYTLTYDPARPVEPGTEVTVTITGTGNYTNAKKTTTFKIGRSLSREAVLTLSSSAFTYNGNELRPRVTVSILSSGDRLVEGTDYEVSYSSAHPINVGEYTVSVTGIGDWAGTLSKTYAIRQGATDNPDDPEDPENPDDPYHPDDPGVPEKPDKPVNPDKDPDDPYPNSTTTPSVTAGTVRERAGDNATATVSVGDDGTVTVTVKNISDGSNANGWVIAGGKTYYVENGVAAIGRTLIGDEVYVFNPDATLGTGIVRDYATGKTYLAATEDSVTPGLVLSNRWVYLDGNWYLTDKDGCVCIGWVVDDETGTKYYFYDVNDSERTGTMARDTWLDVDDEWYVTARDGAVMTGWVADAAGQRYYMNPLVGDLYGAMKTGWVIDDETGERYYCFTEEDGGKTGAMARNGWLWADGDWYLMRPEGTVAAGWAWDNSTRDWYYMNPAFGDDYGRIRTGWVYDGAYGCWFYLFTDADSGTTGALARGGWLLVDGRWYLPDDAGCIRGGWRWVNGAWYHLNERHEGLYGSLDVGWIYDGTGWYLTNAGGAMLMGWQDRDGATYYLDTGTHGSTGRMLTGWQWVDGRWRYFQSWGALLRNGMTPDGYRTDVDGAWV